MPFLNLGPFATNCYSIVLCTIEDLRNGGARRLRNTALARRRRRNAQDCPVSSGFEYPQEHREHEFEIGRGGEKTGIEAGYEADSEVSAVALGRRAVFWRALLRGDVRTARETRARRVKAKVEAEVEVDAEAGERPGSRRDAECSACDYESSSEGSLRWDSAADPEFDYDWLYEGEEDEELVADLWGVLDGREIWRSCLD